MMLSSVLIWISLFPPLTDDDLMRHPEVLQQRMAWLRPGMKEPDVKFVLGIAQRRYAGVYPIERRHGYAISGPWNLIYYYQLGAKPAFELEIVLQAEDGALVSAKIYRPWPKLLASLPSDRSERR